MESAQSGLNGISTEGLLDFNIDVATEEQINSYQSLKDIAREYGLEIEQLIDLLQEMGLVQSDSYNQLVEKFVQENVNKLTPDELEIAYSIENVGDMTFEHLQDEIQKTKEGISKDTISFSALMADSDDNTFLSSVDDYIEKANTLTSAFNAFKNGEFDSADFIELTKKFPELATEADHLDTAIIELLGNMDSDIVDVFNEQFGNLDTDEDIEALKAFLNAVLESGKVVGSTEFAIDIGTGQM